MSPAYPSLAGPWPPGIHVDLCPIGPQDAERLLPQEAASLSARTPLARAASGAARHLARTLMLQAGLPVGPILPGDGGMPLWPDGVSGSLAHDEAYAAAAVAQAGRIAALGIDVEPAEPLPEDLIDLVIGPNDRSGDERAATRAIFCAKEAVYKAVFSLTRARLEYGDITVDLPARSAKARGGHLLSLALQIREAEGRLITLAVLTA